MDEDHALHQELEALAGNAYNPEHETTTGDGETAPLEPIATTIDRWSKLFNISVDEAIDRIPAHRNNLTRPRVSNAHWEIIRSEKELHGYDREAYEYELELAKRKAILPDLVPAAEGAEGSCVTYLVELEGPLDSPQKVREAAEMTEMPAVVSGKSIEEGRPVMLCCVDGAAKTALLRWAAEKGGGFEPTILADPRSLR